MEIYESQRLYSRIGSVTNELSKKIVDDPCAPELQTELCGVVVRGKDLVWARHSEWHLSNKLYRKRSSVCELFETCDKGGFFFNVGLFNLELSD